MEVSINVGDEVMDFGEYPPVDGLSIRDAKLKVISIIKKAARKKLHKARMKERAERRHKDSIEREKVWDELVNGVGFSFSLLSKEMKEAVIKVYAEGHRVKAYKRKTR